MRSRSRNERQELKFLCIEETEEYLELARAKATAVKDAAEFRQGKLDQLELEDNQFDFVIGDGSMADISRIPAMLAEMVRVAKPGATVALSLAYRRKFR